MAIRGILYWTWWRCNLWLDQPRGGWRRHRHSGSRTELPLASPSGVGFSAPLVELVGAVPRGDRVVIVLQLAVREAESLGVERDATVSTLGIYGDTLPFVLHSIYCLLDFPSSDPLAQLVVFLEAGVDPVVDNSSLHRPIATAPCPRRGAGPSASARGRGGGGGTLARRFQVTELGNVLDTREPLQIPFHHVPMETLAEVGRWEAFAGRPLPFEPPPESHLKYVH